MKRSPWPLLLASLAMPLLVRADGDVIIKNGGSVRVNPGASLIVGPNNLVDIQSGAVGYVTAGGEVDGNVTVRSGGTLILCGTITGSLLNLGTLRNCLPRPDALIGQTKNRLRGNNRYSPTGKGQSLSIDLGRRASTSFIVGGQNDGAIPAGLRFRATSLGGPPTFTVRPATGPRVNLTAKLLSGQYLVSGLIPGKTVLLRFSVRAGTPSTRGRTLRIVSDVIAESDNRVRDRAGAKVSQPPSPLTPPPAPLPRPLNRAG